jgi:hypothetical protein
LLLGCDESFTLDNSARRYIGNSQRHIGTDDRQHCCDSNGRSGLYLLGQVKVELTFLRDLDQDGQKELAEQSSASSHSPAAMHQPNPGDDLPEVIIGLDGLA